MKIQQFFLALSLLATTSDAFVPHRVAFTRASAAGSLDASKLERLPESAVQVTIPVPGSATKAAYEKACDELCRTVTIPGFRKGAKVPPQVLEQSMAAKGGRYALKAQAITELLAQLIEPALKDEHGVEPLGKPVLETPAEEMAKDFTPGEDLELVVKCDVWPDIVWKEVEGQEKPYIGLTGKYERKPFDQAKFDKALTDLKERYAELAPIDDADHALEMGDACVVNMEGFMATADGEKGDPLPAAASGDRVEVVLGEGRYMTGLVEGLVGAKVGDTKTVTVRFPDALRDKTLAGKNAIFDVSVLEASTRTLPELTDEFAEKVRAGLTAETLKEELTKAIDNEDSREFAPARNKALSAALSEIIEVEVPDTLVTNQARDKYAMMMSDMRSNGVADEEIKKQITPENFIKYKNVVKAGIVRDFKVSMATDEIARMESIEVPEYQVQEQLEQLKEKMEQGEEIDEAQMRDRIEATIQRELVMDFLAENGNLEVVYTEEEQFDEALLEKLAAETMQREEVEPVAEAAGESTPEVEEAEVVDVEPEAEPEPVAAASSEAPVERDYESMSLEDKAYYALKDSGVLETEKD